MKHLTAFLLLIAFSLPLTSQEGADLKFPNDYFGTYVGILHILNSKGTSTYAMEFRLQPTHSIGRYHYTLIYGEGATRQIREYTLLAEDIINGDYLVDEHNGILLDVKVVENRMYSLFEVGGTLLTTFITFEREHMIFEIIATPRANPHVTTADNEAQTEVISYPITTVQKAVLIKQ